MLVHVPEVCVDVVTIPWEKRKELKTIKSGMQKSDFYSLIIDYFLVSFLKGPFFSNDKLQFSKHGLLFAKFFTNYAGSKCYREVLVTQSKLEIEHVPDKAQFYMFASHHRETLLH